MAYIVLIPKESEESLIEERVQLLSLKENYLILKELCLKVMKHRFHCSYGRQFSLNHCGMGFLARASQSSARGLFPTKEGKPGNWIANSAFKFSEITATVLQAVRKLLPDISSIEEFAYYK